jgi:hypothetical protein
MELFLASAIHKPRHEGSAAMKTAKLLGTVEHEAGRQLTRLLQAAKKGLEVFDWSATTKATAAKQRKYIAAAEKTVAHAEKVIAHLKKRIVLARKTLSSAGRPASKRRTSRRAKSRSGKARRTAKTATRKTARRKSAKRKTARRAG